jgi:hypothetical protein
VPDAMPKFPSCASDLSVSSGSCKSSSCWCEQPPASPYFVVPCVAVGMNLLSAQ